MVVLGAARYGLTPVGDFDVWWHLAAAAEAVRTHSTLPVDPFSYTFAGAPWRYKDLGGELVLYAVYALGGVPGLVLLKAAVLIGVVAVMAYLLLVVHRVPMALASLLLALLVTAIEFRIDDRPDTLALVPFVGLLVVLERHHAGKASLWWAVPLVAVAANVHRSALLLPLLLLAYALADLAARRSATPGGVLPWGRNAAFVALGTLACLCTPAGAAVLPVSGPLLLGTAYRGRIAEWAPTTLATLVAASPATLLLALMALLAAALLIVQRKLRPHDVAWLVAGTAVGMQGTRFLPHFCLLVVLPTAHGLGLLPFAAWQGRLRHSISLLAAAACLVAALAARLPSPRLELDADHFPVRATAFVAAHLARGDLGGVMLNEYHYGGWLMFHLPAVKVYVDGRNDQVYSAAFMDDYGLLFSDPLQLERQVRRWNVSWLFLDRRLDDGGRAAIDSAGRWVLVFASEHGLVYVRRDGVNDALAQASGYRFVQPHRLWAALDEACAVAPLAAVLAEVRRLVVDDPESISAHLALARVLSRTGEAGRVELQGVEDRLLELGWRPAAVSP